MNEQNLPCKSGRCHLLRNAGVHGRPETTMHHRIHEQDCFIRRESVRIYLGPFAEQKLSEHLLGYQYSHIRMNVSSLWVSPTKAPASSRPSKQSRVRSRWRIRCSSAHGRMCPMWRCTRHWRIFWTRGTVSWNSTFALFLTRIRSFCWGLALINHRDHRTACINKVVTRPDVKFTNSYIRKIADVVTYRFLNASQITWNAGPMIQCSWKQSGGHLG